MEALFAELKNYIGPPRLRLRRMRFVRERFYLAAKAQNLGWVRPSRLNHVISRVPLISLIYDLPRALHGLGSLRSTSS